MINITFPDGSVRSYQKGATPLSIAESISPSLARDILSATVNSKVVEITRPINEDSTVKFHKWEDPQGKSTFWHSSSHLMAEALEQLYPGIKFGIGPSIETGFYYDVDPGERNITESDLKQIEEKMLELAREKQHFIRREVSKEEALRTYEQKGMNTNANLSKIWRTEPYHSIQTAPLQIFAEDLTWQILQ